MEVYFVYILYSQIKDRYYVGYTSDDLQERLRKHNSNHKGFTGGIRDWVVVYTETYSEKKDAMLREQQIKKWKSRRMVESLIGTSGRASRP